MIVHITRKCWVHYGGWLYICTYNPPYFKYFIILFFISISTAFFLSFFLPSFLILSTLPTYTCWLLYQINPMLNRKSSAHCKVLHFHSYLLFTTNIEINGLDFQWYLLLATLDPSVPCILKTRQNNPVAILPRLCMK